MNYAACDTFDANYLLWFVTLSINETLLGAPDQQTIRTPEQCWTQAWLNHFGPTIQVQWTN